MEYFKLSFMGGKVCKRRIVQMNYHQDKIIN